MSKSEDIRAAYRLGMRDVTALAELTQASEDLVRQALRRMKLSRRKRPKRLQRFLRLDLARPELAAMGVEAARRGFSTASMATRLLVAISKDQMFDVVLDDLETVEKAS